jgi:uncharacterized protein YcbK (DUF882 family)
MIKLTEILRGADFSKQPQDTQNNLTILLERINLVRQAYGKPMIVTSGLRTLEDHYRIYRSKGIPDDKIPLKSQHLFGAAVDIADSQKELQSWCLNNIQVLENSQLWLEDFKATPNWCHFQIYPPKSKKRFFMP